MRNIVNALFLRDGMVLLARRGPHRSAYPDRWSFPGGHVEQDETLTEALVREVRCGTRLNRDRRDFATSPSPVLEPPAMPGMLRKSAALVPRYQRFESISLQRRVVQTIGSLAAEPSLSASLQCVVSAGERRCLIAFSN